MIDATARVDTNATIGQDVSIGPYCIVGPDVTLNDGVRLVAHVHVTGHTTIGERTVVYPFVSLGTPPQSVHYHGEATLLKIGAGCDIREGVTMNIGTTQRGVTTVGDKCFFMAGSHVAHDCIVGDNVTFAQGAVIGGHCEVGDYAFLGGLAAVHQFTRLGESAMIGGLAGVRGDVIPFGLVDGAGIARLAGVNAIGMRRRGFKNDAIRAVRAAWHLLFDQKQGELTERIAQVDAQYADCEAVRKITAFMREAAARPFCWPRGRKPDEGQNGSRRSPE